MRFGLVSILCLLAIACDSGTDDLTGRQDPEPPPDTIRGRVVDLTAGDHACVATSDGTIYCWGGGSFGQLGDGDVRSRTGPTGVLPKTTFTMVTAGRRATCALDTGGQAWCWGINLMGELGHAHADTFVNGDPAFPVASEPFPVETTVPFEQIETVGGAFSHTTCALDPAGTIWCWGRGRSGQGGTGSSDLTIEPAPVSGGHRFVDLAVGDDHACGVDEDGQVWCWGSNGAGQLGGSESGLSVCADSAEPCALEPVAVEAPANFVEIEAGGGFTCGLLREGDSWCWGRADFGQTGSGETAETTPPKPVVGNHEFASLAAGGSHVCGLTENGEAWCWGNGNRGILGVDPGGLASCGPISANKCSPTPVRVSGGFRFERLAPGNGFTCGVALDGLIRCWGDNTRGVLGIGVEGGWESTPVPVVAQR